VLCTLAPGSCVVREHLLATTRALAQQLLLFLLVFGSPRSFRCPFFSLFYCFWFRAVVRDGLISTFLLLHQRDVAPALLDATIVQ